MTGVVVHPVINIGLLLACDLPKEVVVYRVVRSFYGAEQYQPYLADLISVMAQMVHLTFDLDLSSVLVTIQELKIRMGWGGIHSVMVIMHLGLWGVRKITN